ncbi:MAG: hypothetical protein EA409_03655 [Saprospirales bacterium]|nr:MAG: hypothetical protein EA409_03655 [Saprospirales bacterium]
MVLNGMSPDAFIQNYPNMKISSFAFFYESIRLCHTRQFIESYKQGKGYISFNSELLSTEVAKF